MEPEEIEGRQFGAALRGYDRQEVEDFIREVADQVRQLRSDLTETQAALKVAQAVRPPAPAPPPPPPPPTAQPEKTDVFKQLGEETARILISAEQAGNEIKERAKREAAEVLADSRRDAGRIARQARENKQRAEGDLRQVMQTRASLANQLEDVRRRLGEAVARLQAPLEPTSSDPARPSLPDVLPSIAKSEQGSQDHPAGPEQKSGEVEPESKGSFSSETGSPPVEVADPGGTQPPSRMSRDDIDKPSPLLPSRSATNGSTHPPKPDFETKVSPSNGGGRKSHPSRDIVEQLLEEIREDAEGIGSAGGPPPASPQAPASPSAPASGRSSSRHVPSPPVSEPAALSSAGEPRSLSSSKRSTAISIAGGDLSADEQEAILKSRAEALGDSPLEAARKLKRLLQEEHNDLLHRLRSQRGRGTLADNMAPEQEQLDRFTSVLGGTLLNAFAEGRKLAGGKTDGDPGISLSSLVARQVVLPLRGELCQVIEAGLAAKDTPSAVSERASDVFRIWKGVRTELLGEGLVHAAFHLGLLDAWGEDRKTMKRWVLSDEEQQCPEGVCQVNASEGSVPVGGQFSSGHISPPAHGGCTCGLQSS